MKRPIHDNQTKISQPVLRRRVVAPSFTRKAGWVFCFQIMNWFNLNVATLRSPEYIGSDPVARATWLNVSVWCCEQENGGRIFGAKLWKDRQWQQICGVTIDEVNQASPLLFWEENDLIVWAYPKEKEELVQTKRKAGSLGGRSKSQAKTEASRSNGAKHNPSTTQAESEAEPKQEPNGKEGKGKEGKENRNGSREIVADGSATNDDSWINELQAQSAYQYIDVARELSKMRAWCAANKKMPTRRRFVNWLNRVDKPLIQVTGKVFDDFKGTTFR